MLAQAPSSLRASSASTSRPQLPCLRSSVVMRSNAGRPSWSTGDEGAAQVKRLISRDKKEFLGNTTDILDKYTTEFGEGDSAAPVELLAPIKLPEISAGAVNPFSAPAPVSADNPFKQSPPPPAAAGANPFGSAPISEPFQRTIEPKGLRPDMSPDALVKETPIAFLKSITLTQVVLVLSFSTIIGIMLVTFSVVLNSGAIRLAGIE